MVMLRLLNSFFGAMLPYMILSLPLYLPCRWWYLRRHMGRAGSSSLAHELGLLVFTLLLAGLASQAVLPQLEFGADGLQLAQTGHVSGFNFIPLRIFIDSWQQALQHGNLRYFFINFIGNIGVFLPLGFFPPLLWRVSCGRVLRNALLCSLFIELCQIPQARGTDIDDLWLNTLGALLGYVLYRLLSRMLPDFCAKFRLSLSK